MSPKSGGREYLYAESIMSSGHPTNLRHGLIAQMKQNGKIIHVTMLVRMISTVTLAAASKLRQAMMLDILLMIDRRRALHKFDTSI